MRAILLAIMFFASFAQAYSYSDVLRDYAAKDYEKVCREGAVYINKNDKNEQVLVAIGDSCAKTDMINPLSNIARLLVSTKEYREAGSYFATLMLQKKLIYQFMLDKTDLKDLRLPTTDHLLSRVFIELSKGNYKENDGQIEIENGNMQYTMWVEKGGISKVYIDEKKEGVLIQKHIYY